MGVGIANQLMAPAGAATSGVDWSQAAKVGNALLWSPIMGFVFSALLLLVMKFIIRNPKLYREPEADKPPPLWIRITLIGTCTGVSFAHGSNDGQKGMGLIMLILIGAVSTAYALNRTLPDNKAAAFVAHAEAAAQVFAAHAGNPPPLDLNAARALGGSRLAAHKVDTPEAMAALKVLATEVGAEVKTYGSIRHIPAARVPNVRNDMYLVGDALRILEKDKASPVTVPEKKTLKAFKGDLEAGTRFIPFWVKLAVAVALGLGTMVGWKRIVLTVGERIGKTHLTYAQGAAAELVAAVMISAADTFGLPVSTTHVLSSGVAGTMAANNSGLQWSTIRSIASAWVMTLPAAMAISGTLYYLLRHLV